MRSVKLERKFLDDYRGIVSEEYLDALRNAAESLQGKRILHVNSTAYGGGVAELLSSLVPLMRDVGLDAHWNVIEGDLGFFTVTKTLHNGLQGGDVVISEGMREEYMDVNRRNAEGVEDEWDFVVVHDPQPAALIDFVKKKSVWIWRCHIDLSTPNQDSMALLSRFLPSYDSSIYTMDDYVPPSIGGGPTSPIDGSESLALPARVEHRKSATIIHPSIDPLTSKNRPLSPEEITTIAERYGVDPDKPTISAVARFDPWKDPLGIIDLYRVVKGTMMLDTAKKRLRIFDFLSSVKRKVPDLQLLLAASMAEDDPEAWEYYERTLRKAGEDPNIFFLTNLRGVGGREVNAFQRCSDVSLLMSIREGFGLSVTESLWKQIPVVGARVGGIPLQVIDGETGFLAQDSMTAAKRMTKLLGDEGLRKRMGKAGKEHVRRNFLVTRHLRDYVDLFNSLADDAPGRAS